MLVSAWGNVMSLGRKRLRLHVHRAGSRVSADRQVDISSSSCSHAEYVITLWLCGMSAMSTWRPRVQDRLTTMTTADLITWLRLFHTTTIKPSASVKLATVKLQNCRSRVASNIYDDCYYHCWWMEWNRKLNYFRQRLISFYATLILITNNIDFYKYIVYVVIRSSSDIQLSFAQALSLWIREK